MLNSLIHYLELLPENLRAQDLVDIGFYPSIKSCNAKGYQTAPDHFIENRRVWFPKNKFIIFLKERYVATKRGRRKYIANISIEQIKNTFPYLMTPAHLITLNIFNNEDQAYSCRASNCGPSYIKVGHKILYIKDHLIELIEQSKE